MEEEVVEEEVEVGEGEELVEEEQVPPSPRASKTGRSLNLLEGAGASGRASALPPTGGKRTALPARPENVGSIAGGRVSDGQKKKAFKRPAGSPTCYGDPETYDPEGSDMCKFCPYQETCGQTIEDAA